MIVDAQMVKKKKVVSKPVEETAIDIPSMIQAGLRMSTDEFEAFVQSRLVFKGRRKDKSLF